MRLNGLAGGGTEEAVGTRWGLLRYLRHTLGVNSVFGHIHRDLRGVGGDAALLEWRNAAAAADAQVYPDGYGVVRLRGALYGFFLEYDRATARARDYRAKLRAYLEYSLGGRHLRRYDGLPTILFVTQDAKSEERIARACREVDPEGRLPPASDER